MNRVDDPVAVCAALLEAICLPDGSHEDPHVLIVRLPETDRFLGPYADVAAALAAAERLELLLGVAGDDCDLRAVPLQCPDPDAPLEVGATAM